MFKKILVTMLIIFGSGVFAEDFASLEEFGNKFDPPLSQYERSFLTGPSEGGQKGRVHSAYLKPDTSFRGLKCSSKVNLSWANEGVVFQFPVPHSQSKWCEFSDFKFHDKATFTPAMKLRDLSFSAPSASLKVMYKGIDVSGRSVFLEKDKNLDYLLIKVGIRPVRYFYSITKPSKSKDDVSVGYLFLDPVQFLGQRLAAGTYIMIRNKAVSYLEVPGDRVIQVNGVPCGGKKVSFSSGQLESCHLGRIHQFKEGVVLPKGTFVEVVVDDSKKPFRAHLTAAGPFAEDITLEGVRFKKGKCAWWINSKPQSTPGAEDLDKRAYRCGRSEF